MKRRLPGLHHLGGLRNRFQKKLDQPNRHVVVAAHPGPMKRKCQSVGPRVYPGSVLRKQSGVITVPCCTSMGRGNSPFAGRVWAIAEAECGEWERPLPVQNVLRRVSRVRRLKRRVRKRVEHRLEAPEVANLFPGRAHEQQVKREGPA